jgi:dihydrofolate reductase
MVSAVSARNATDKVRAFVACSLDGFLAGPDDDLSWLPDPDPDEDYGYAAFIAETDAILMGRGTYDVAAGFPEWPYGTTPVFVATSRPLEPAAGTVKAIGGTPAKLLTAVRKKAKGAIYVDGGTLIRGFLDAGALDELVVTIVPIVLGSGAPLLAGTAERHRLVPRETRTYASGLVQLRYDVVPPPPKKKAQRRSRAKS